MRFLLGMMLVIACWAGAASAQRVQAPGGFVPQQAVAFGAQGASATGVDGDHPLPVQPMVTAVTYLDRSGSLAVAGVSQAVAPARAGRRGFFLQNLSGGELWIGFGTAATAGTSSIRLAAGQLYESPAGGVPADAISVVGSSAGQSFTAKEW
jgi:hypothetical protein